MECDGSSGTLIKGEAMAQQQAARLSRIAKDDRKTAIGPVLPNPMRSITLRMRSSVGKDVR